MTSLARRLALGVALAIGVTVGGCASHRGGVIQETREITFDDIAAAAAAETAESENGLR